VFATEIVSDVSDYRYAGRDGGSLSMRVIDLPVPIGVLLALARRNQSGADARVQANLLIDGTAIGLERAGMPPFHLAKHRADEPVEQIDGLDLAGAAATRSPLPFSSSGAAEYTASNEVGADVWLP